MLQKITLKSISLAFFVTCFSTNILAGKSGTTKQVSPQSNYTKVSSGNYGFIENKGQITDQNYLANPAVKFLLNMGGLNVQLKANSFSYDTYTLIKKKIKRTDNPIPQPGLEDEFAVSYQFHRIDIEFKDANPNPVIVAANPSSDYINYFTAGTPESGINAVKHFGKVTYYDLYPHIDLEFYARPGTSKPVEYNFIIHPGADLSLIQWQYKGSDHIVLKEGKIQIQTANGSLFESVPMSFEKENGNTIKLNYKNIGNGLFSFDAHDYNKQNTLIIDPIPDLKVATYYGDVGVDYAQGITSDLANNIYVTGATTSTTNIASSGAYQTTYGGTGTYSTGGDVFIVMFNSTGTRLWATYYGGTGNEVGQGIKVDNSGNIYVYGMTTSTTGFGTTGTFQPTFAGGTYFDVFLAKFGSSGSRIWGTYYGGNGNDRGTPNGIVLDTSGNIYITGTNNTANSSAITTPGAYQATNGSTSAYDEPFAAKFSPSGSIIWGTYVGGGGNFHDQGYAIALDASNNVYLTGACLATAGVTTAGAHQSTLGGGTDAFIAKLNSTGTALLYGTYYGGSLGEVGQGISVDAAGNITLTGYTAGSTAGIASTGAYQTTFGGGTYDAFIAKFNASGVRQWGTYYGGIGADITRSGKGDLNGNFYVLGDATTTTGIATFGSYQTTIAGANDVFVTKFNPLGVPIWGTYYGGTLEDLPFNIDLDGRGNIYLAGRTVSASGIATTGAYRTIFGGGTYDGFAAKFQEQGTYNNAGVTALISPNKFCTNIQSVKVRIKNNGANRIDSVLVNWELDAMLQTPVMWRYTLDTLGGVGRTDTVVTLSNNVSFTTGVSRTIRAWTSMPNNTPDTTNYDDTIFVTLKKGLSGSYSIDPFGDYPTFTAAVYDLNNYGHCGPVNFSVTSGISFPENPIIITRSGTATDSIVFQKSNSGPNPVIFGRNGGGTLDAVITLAGASYITFDGIDVADSLGNLTAATQMEIGYRLMNASSVVGSSNNKIKNCKVILRRTNTASMGILQSTVNAAASLLGGNHNNSYENIRIENSYNGILLSGTAAFPDSNNVITSSGTDSTIIGADLANDIGNGTLLVNGIQANEQKNLEISKCTIRNLTHTSTLLPSGIWLNNISSTANYGKARIYNNTIFNLSRTSATATGGLTGIRIDVSPNASALVYNNQIYGLSTANPAAASAVFLLRGIAQSVTAANGNAEYYYNSVSINTTATNPSAAAFWKAGTGSVICKNNIFSCVTGAQTGVAKHYGSYIGAGSVSDASNNVLWAPNTNGFVGYLTSDRATLQLYAAAVSPAAPADGNERGSASADPNFTSASDLTFAGNSPASLNGTQITNPAIITDITGATRNVSRPAIGAFETFMLQLDSSAPVISNVQVFNSNTPVVLAQINDKSNAAYAGDVRLWYRAGGSGMYSSFAPDSVPSASINGTYKWAASLSTLLVGTYQFYIAARDQVGQGVNIAINPMYSTAFTGFNPFDPVNFTGNPDASANTRTFMKTVTLAGGTYTVGPTGNYANLTAVANTLNSSALLGHVVFRLQSNYDGTTGETFPITFNELMVNGGNWTATIRPDTSVTARETSGDPGSGIPLIVLNGAKRIIFDGRPGSTGTALEWTFRNKRTAASFSPAFTFQNGAQQDTLRYLKIESANSLATSGTIFFSNSTTFGNSYNKIDNCEIRDRSDITGVPAIGIYSLGTLNMSNDSNAITNNKIYNWSSIGIAVAGSGNGAGWNISNNSFYMTAAQTTDQTAISFLTPGTSGIRSRINSNYIGGTAALCGGTAWVNSGALSWRGIVCNTATADSTFIQNNTIQNISLTSTTGTYAAIDLAGGLSSIRGNTLGHNTTLNSIVSAQLGVMGNILIGAANTSQVYDNLIANIRSTGNATSASHCGMRISSAAAIIRNNTIHDLNADNPTVSSSVPAISGILLLNAGTQQSILNNTLYNISTSGGSTAAATSSFGINVSGAGTTGTISGNKIYGITNTSASNAAQVAGIHIDLSGPISVYNNMISLGTNVDSSAVITGINDKSASTGNTIYYNSVLISGAAISTAATLSQAYRRSSTASVILKDNIFKNTRTGGTANYAIANTASTPATGWTANYNDLSSANAAQLGLWNATATAFAAWKTTSANDSASVNYAPVFVSATDLHLTGSSLGNTALKGNPIAGISSDFDGQVRHAVFPYMGADEAIPSLPVKLLDFAASQVKNDILISWTTAQEMNSSRFELERSLNTGEAWETLANIKAAGNSNSLRNYDWLDQHVVDLFPIYKHLFYRLKMFDRDGSFSYSPTVSISLDKNQDQTVSVYPNPFSENLSISIMANETAVLHLTLFDMNGKEMHSISMQVEQGSKTIYLTDFANLDGGIYFLKMTIADQTKMVKLVKLR